MTPQPQPITGYRQLSEREVALINRIKALGAEVGELVAELRGYPATPASGIQLEPGRFLLPSLDQRWVSLGATNLQQGFMALTRGVAQPNTFA